MNIKKVMSLLMLCTIIITQVSMPVNAEGKKPILEITNTEIPKGGAGRTIDIPITIKNSSTKFAKEIKITADLSGEDNPFIIEQLNLTKVIKKLSTDKSENIQYKFKLNKNAKAKLYPLKLKFEYKNAYDTSFTDIKTIYIRVVDVHIPTKLVVDNVTTIPNPIVAGKEVDVEVKVKNTGTLAANNITISMKENDKFSIVDSVSDKQLYSIGGIDSKSVKYKLRPKDNLESGTYKIDLELKYIDNKNQEIKREQGIYIQVVKDGDSSNNQKSSLKIENVVGPKGEIQYQNKFNIKFNLNNTGLGNAKNVKVSASSDDANLFPVSQSKFIVGDVASKKRIPFNFVFSSTNEIKTKNYPIKITVEYDVKKNKQIETQKIEQFVGALIKGKVKKDDSKTMSSVPKIIIQNYSTNPQKIVKAGENFTLNMTFLNTNKNKSIKNMKVTLRAKGATKSETTGKTDNVFTPQETSNIFYIDELRPKQTMDKKMIMYTLPDASAKTYPIEIEFDYEYEQAGEIKSNKMTNEIGIHVVQPSRLEVGQIQPPQDIVVGKPADLTVEFYNRGKVNLGNLMVKTVGDFEVRDGNYFVGTFKMGNTENYYPKIIAKGPGAKKGKVIFTYEDSTGKEQKVEREFTINVTEGMENQSGESELGQEVSLGSNNGQEVANGEGNNTVLYIVFGVGALALIVISIVVINKIKNKRGMNEDEEI